MALGDNPFPSNLANSLGGGLGERQEAQYPPYDPATHRRLVDQLLAKSMGLLQYAGETLDKPGRAVRGLLAGRPGELANLIPFSDMMGITDPTKATSGRDLLEQSGVLDKNKPGLDWGDVAGFGVDLLTDPLTYVGLGGLTKAGKAAAKTAEGATVGIGKGIAAGDRYAARVGIPFTGLGAEFGAGSDRIGNAVTSATDALSATAPVRYGRALFDPRTAGLRDPLEQEVAGLRHGLLPDAKRAATMTTLEKGDELESAYKALDDSFGPSSLALASKAGELPQEAAKRDLFNRAIRLSAEMRSGREAALADPLADPIAEHAGDVFKHYETVKPIADSLIEAKDSMWRSIGEKGGNTQSIANQFPRYGEAKNFSGEARLAGARMLRTGFASMEHRIEAIADLPAEVANAALHDPAARGKEAVGHIAATYAPWLKAATPEELTAKAENLASYIAERPAERRVGTREVVQDLGDYLKHGAIVDSSLDAIHELYSRHLTSPVIPGTPPVHGSPIGEGFLSNGFTPAQAFANTGHGVYQMRPEQAVAYLSKKTGTPVDELSQMRIPVDVVQAANGLLRTVNEPVWAGIIKETVDGLTNSWKRWVTQPFPGFHIRNLTSGQAVNLTSGLIETPQDAISYARHFAEALSGLKNPDPALMRELEVGGVIDPRSSFDVIQNVARKGVVPENPLRIGTTSKQVDQWMLQHPSMIDSLPGGETARNAVGTLAQTGSKTTGLVEYMNRTPIYTYLKEKGWAPQAAAKKTLELQFEYSKQSLTPFENDVMRRIVPFYVYNRRVIPLVLKNIAERPGGPMAQAIRATQEPRQQGGFLPEHIGEGAAIPLSDSRFITGFGLPWEQAFSNAVIGPTVGKTIGRTLEKNVGNMNPLIGAAYTLASGRDPFTGRDTSGLYPYPTSSPTANTLLAKTPVSRAISSFRQVTDERKEPLTKAIDLLTGVKVQDVTGGIERQKQLETRKVLDAIMSESPHLRQRSEFYVDPAQRALLTDEEQRNLRIAAGLNREGREFAKARKASELFGVKPL